MYFGFHFYFTFILFKERENNLEIRLLLLVYKNFQERENNLEIRPLLLFCKIIQERENNLEISPLLLVGVYFLCILFCILLCLSVYCVILMFFVINIFYT